MLQNLKNVRNKKEQHVLFFFITFETNPPLLKAGLNFETLLLERQPLLQTSGLVLVNFEKYPLPNNLYYTRKFSIQTKNVMAIFIASRKSERDVFFENTFTANSFFSSLYLHKIGSSPDHHESEKVAADSFNQIRACRSESPL